MYTTYVSIYIYIYYIRIIYYILRGHEDVSVAASVGVRRVYNIFILKRRHPDRILRAPESGGGLVEGVKEPGEVFRRERHSG